MRCLLGKVTQPRMQEELLSGQSSFEAYAIKSLLGLKLALTVTPTLLSMHVPTPTNVRYYPHPKGPKLSFHYHPFLEHPN